MGAADRSTGRLRDDCPRKTTTSIPRPADPKTKGRGFRVGCASLPGVASQPDPPHPSPETVAQV